jgi:RNA polymerase sigma-70 factor, ECF subfamily
LVAELYLSERGRILATLIRLARNFEDAEEVLQEAFLAAGEHWARQGAPDNPGAWLLTVAKRKLLDRRRVESRRRELIEQFAPTELIVDIPEEEELADDRLRLIFTCCHPALAPEASIALTLRTLGGLETAEIARAFLLPETTMAQRLLRVKRKISAAGIPYRIPDKHELPERLDSVLHVIYLIFNEGYAATGGERLLREELCQEAIRLLHLLNDLVPGRAEVEGLLALLLLTHSRRLARADAQGRLIALDEQDRQVWQRGEIEAGLKLVEQALRRKSLGKYQLLAAMAAVHCEAASAAETDWKQIAALYRELLQWDDSPIVRLNHAVAVAYAEGWEAGWALLARIDGLAEYHPYFAAKAQILQKLGRLAEARVAFERAIALTQNAAEREYLSRKLAQGNS